MVLAFIALALAFVGYITTHQRISADERTRRTDIRDNAISAYSACLVSISFTEKLNKEQEGIKLQAELLLASLQEQVTALAAIINIDKPGRLREEHIIHLARLEAQVATARDTRDSVIEFPLRTTKDCADARDQALAKIGEGPPRGI